MNADKTIIRPISHQFVFRGSEIVRVTHRKR